MASPSRRLVAQQQAEATQPLQALLQQGKPLHVEIGGGDV